MERRAREMVRPLLIILIILFISSTLQPAALEARSLWTDDRDLMSDFRAMRVGDQLTVLIVEMASGSNKADTRTEKEASAGFEGGPGAGKLDFIPLVGLSGEWSSEHRGKGSTTRSNQVQGKMTVEVIVVRPNGDLEVIGMREVRVNNETHRFRLTGVVRPRDISADNTILSTYIGNAKVEYGGKGAVSDGQDVGWWLRVLHWVF